MKSWLFNNLGLKIAALILAIISYSYISGEVRRSRGPQEGQILGFGFGYKLLSKEVTIYPSIVGAPEDGYKVDYGRIKITPGKYVLVGPADLVEKIEHIKTTPIPVEGLKATFNVTTGLKPIHDRIPLTDQTVTVYVPIVSEK